MVKSKPSKGNIGENRSRQKISRTHIKEALDRAEQGLERCWAIFHLKKGEQNAAAVLSLQPSLLKVLANAENVYREIAQEKQRLIDRKGQLSRTWFSRRMAQLDHYAECIKIVLGVGRAIGDGFAWMFYRGDDLLVDEHLKSQRQPMLPPGAGGRGEKIFLERFQNANGTLAIYHGLTSFLRMGDFSFYDPIKQRIVAIGELKTVANEDGSHHLHMNIIAHYDSTLMQAAKNATVGKDRPERRALPAHQANRLKRQVSHIIKAIKEVEWYKADEKVSAIKKIDMSQLQSVLDVPEPPGVKSELVGKGLLLVSVASPGSISERALGTKRNITSERFKGIEQHVMKIINQGAADNAVILNMVGFSEDHQPYMLPGTTPLFWWPLNERQKHDLIFGRLIVMSCYNPSHFFSMLRQRGYEVDADTTGRLTTAKKSLPDGKVIGLENFVYFQKLATGYLLDEDVIDNILEVMEQQAIEKWKGGPARIQLRPRIVYG